MSSLAQSLKKTLLIDVLILFFCVFGVFNIIYKANLPFDVVVKDAGLIVNSEKANYSNLHKNDVIISLDNIHVSSIEEIEILLDSKTPVEKAIIVANRENQKINSKVTLIAFYSKSYVAIAAVVGVMFFFVAIFVFVKSEDKEVGHAIHWAFVFTAMIILMTWGNFTKLPFKLGVITRIAFHIGYLFAPLYFLKFSLVFPSRHKFYNSKILTIIKIISFLLVAILSTVFVLGIENQTSENIKLYINAFNLCTVFIVTVVLLAITIYANNYITTNSVTERKKLRWLLLGFIVGPLSYLFLWVIPTRIWNEAIIPEAVIVSLNSFVPITFGIAIFKHRLFNIDIIFKRGLVYSSVIIALLIVYIVILSVAAKLLNDSSSEIASIIAAVTIALMFQPAKQKIQKFVDKKFFRIEYDYRKAINLFNNKVKDIHDSKDLLKSVINLINNLILLDKVGFFHYDSEKGTMLVKEHINFESFEKRRITVLPNILIHQFDYPITTSKNIESDVEIIKQPFTEIDEINNSLIFNLKSPKFNSHGFLILGQKKSDTKFTAEDVDLISNICSQVSLTIEKIRLQEEVIKEQVESQRLEELNELKSFLVSSVSHDLKTPLTSIKLFTERLKTSSNISLEKANEYLEIIEGESDRLTRLINNVLDYSKIEKGIQKYRLEKVNIIQIIKKVINNLEYQLKMKKFKTDIKYNREEINIWADEDAISEALINLITNAIKFSDKEKEIRIVVKDKDEFTIVHVIDQGKGIAKENLKNIFDPFFKTGNIKNENLGGAGLGLAIVKHIMEAHGGKVIVESKLNQGSKFTLCFRAKL